MKRVLIDSQNNIIYEGVDAKDVLSTLTKEPEDVTEEDEVRFQEQLMNYEWIGDLRYEVHFDLKFRGIDDWNRPVFKDMDSSLHFGDVNKLWGWEDDKKDIQEYYKNHPFSLEYFGDKFNCEPHGGKQDFFKFKIID